MPGFERGDLSVAPSTALADAVVPVPQVSRSNSLSVRLWGLNLNKGLPRTLTSDGVYAAPGDMSRVRDFLAQNFPTFREEDLGASLSTHILEAKRWYLNNACDVLELRHDERTVGVLIGAPEDWSSYYVRMFAVLQTYQRPAVRRRFIRECLFEPLIAHGVERVIADTSPTNLGMAFVFNELHFHVTGHQLSDRWGPLIRYTKFLDPACEAAFHRRFAGISGGATSDGKEEPP